LARRRILLAEDHVEMARRLQSLLSFDYDVEVVPNGTTLIAAVHACNPDVIVSGIMMPGISGLDATREILAAHPDSRVVLVSVRTEPAIISKALSAGALGYVVKSDAGDELIDAVKAALQGGRFVSSSAKAALNRFKKHGE
jgi:DNA-binding NarL/FixJ family response regulator